MFNKFFCKLVKKKEVTIGDVLNAIIIRPEIFVVLGITMASVIVAAVSVDMSRSMGIDVGVFDFFEIAFYMFVKLSALSIACVIIVMVWMKLMTVKVATCPLLDDKKEDGV
jgi:hypothetical protein